MSTTNGHETKNNARRGLGRGLSALIPTGSDGPPPAPTEMRAAQPEPPVESKATVSDGLASIPLTRIALNPYQPRDTFAPEALEELTASVRKHGVLQPVVVRPKSNGNYELVAGERRFRAATAAGLAEIPAVVRELSDQEALALALIENLQREDLNPVEEARAFRRLIDEFGLTQAQLALEMGKSQASIGNALRLLALPSGVLDDVASGALTEGHAKAILSLHDLTMQNALRQEIVSRRMSVRDAERRAAMMKKTRFIPRGIKPATSAPIRPATELDIHAIESELSTMLGTGVRFKFANSNRGRIEIDFYDPEQLDGVIQRLLDLRPGQG